MAEYTLDNLIFHTDFTDVPNTGSTTAYQTIRCPMKEYLTAGRHVFTLLVDKGGFYINNMTFSLVPPAPTFTIPGTVEAEDYSSGSDGVAVAAGNGGFALGNFNNNQYVDYSVDITDTGKYSYEVTASSEVAGSGFNMSLVYSDGTVKNLLTVYVSNTGSKDTYKVVTGKIRNKINVTGKHTLRFTATAGSCNIDKVKLICTESTGISTIDADEESDAPAYNLMGLPVSEGYRGMVIQNGKKVIKR